MTIALKIEDSTGKSYGAKVTSRGQLVVAPLSFSDAYSELLDTDNSIVNIVPADSGNQFVITAIIASGNKNVGTDGSFVEIFEADSDGGDSEKELFDFIIARNANLPVTPLNLITNEGKWINARCDDDDVYLTICGYYIEAE